MHGNSKDAGTFLSDLHNLPEFTGKMIDLNLLKSAVDKEGDEDFLKKKQLVRRVLILPSLLC